MENVYRKVKFRHGDKIEMPIFIKVSTLKKATYFDLVSVFGEPTLIRLKGNSYMQWLFENLETGYVVSIVDTGMKSQIDVICNCLEWSICLPEADKKTNISTFYNYMNKKKEEMLGVLYN